MFTLDIHIPYIKNPIYQTCRYCEFFFVYNHIYISNVRYIRTSIYQTHFVVPFSSDISELKGTQRCVCIYSLYIIYMRIFLF